MTNEIPATMRAVVLNAYDGKPTLETIPTPQPSDGQVLVKIHAAPINPSDLLFTEGQYGVRKALPTVPGFEASGTVVATGGGAWARTLVGRRVACTATNESGTWAEYTLADASGCIPLLPNVSLEQGAMLLVNPMTAWAMVDLARKAGAKAIIQTAAASALGKMVVRLCQRENIPLINIVRREEQAEQLRQLGASLMLNSTDADFTRQLRELAREHRATYALDAVSGPLTVQLAENMPRSSTVLVYGALANDAANVNPSLLIFRDATIRGFWLSTWLPAQGPTAILKAAVDIQRLIATDLRSEVRACLPLEQIQHAMAIYSAKMTEGKVLLMPGLGSRDNGRTASDAGSAPSDE